jgi:hypothetical protein
MSETQTTTQTKYSTTNQSSEKVNTSDGNIQDIYYNMEMLYNCIGCIPMGLCLELKYVLKRVLIKLFCNVSYKKYINV